MFKEERATVLDLMEKYANEYFIVKFDSIEVMNDPVDVTLVAVSSNESELMVYQSNHEERGLMCVVAGNAFYEYFAGGAWIGDEVCDYYLEVTDDELSDHELCEEELCAEKDDNDVNGDAIWDEFMAKLNE